MMAERKNENINLQKCTIYNIMMRLLLLNKGIKN